MAGTYSGTISLDARGSTPLITLNQHASNVDVAALLQDFAKTKRLSGRADLTSDLAASSNEIDALLHSLNGHVTTNIAHGAMEGIDLPFEVDRARALVQRQSMPAGHRGGRTSFETFHASADVNAGVATTRDLDIATQDVRVTGQGTYSLVSQAIDYRLQVAVLKGSTGAASASGATAMAVPLDVTGTLTSPPVRPDVQRLAQAGMQQLQQQRSQLQHKGQQALKGLLKQF